MREKLIDSALLVGLAVVCVVIVITLFFPARRSPEAAAPPATPVETSQGEATPDETGVPLISEGETAAPEPVVAPEPPADTESATPEEASAEINLATAPSPSETATDSTAESTASTPAPPLPEGAFDLERVGFSFAGGTGACSVPLEAWRHVAVSRDILAKYPCGSEITIDLDEPVAGHDSFRAIVGDTMNPSNVRTVNVYVAPDEPAFEYGIKAGRLEP